MSTDLDVSGPAATPPESPAETCTVGPAGSTSTTPLDDQLCFALYAATNAIVRAYRPMLQEMGVTYPQYTVLLLLWERDPLSVGDLAARLGLPVNGLSPVLGRMEQTGLVVRRRSPEDRRTVLVSLTDEGRDLEAAAARAQDVVRCRTDLPPEAFASLRSELRLLTTALGDGPG